jgi:hypothetical protein
MTDHPATVPGAREARPGSVVVKWGLSVLDWRSHAINEHAEHPTGVLKAECGHLLMTVTTLRETPYTAPCEACATLQFDRAVSTEVPPVDRP